MSEDERVPVAEIFARAREKNWPTSSIDAMANHHLCGNLARDYVNDCFTGTAASREDAGPAEACTDAAPCGPAGAVSTYPEGNVDG